MTGARRHIAIHLDGEVARRLDEWRRRWDPVMAARTPPHVTVVTPEETVDERQVLERLDDLADDLAPFDIALGRTMADDDGRGGVFVEVHDPSGALETVRDRLLLPPQRFGGFPFHSTIAHPRTSADPAACWQHLAGATVARRPSGPVARSARRPP